MRSFLLLNFGLILTQLYFDIARLTSSEQLVSLADIKFKLILEKSSNFTNHIYNLDVLSCSHPFLAAAQMQIIQKALNSFSTVSCIRFIPQTTEKSYVNITSLNG